MKAWLVAVFATLTLACSSKVIEQAPPAQTAEPAAATAKPNAHRADLLARLEAVLRKESPSLAARLRPGATDAQIAAFEKYLGFPLPETLKDIYRWHDGVDTKASGRYDPPDMFFDYWLAPLAKVQEHHAMMRKFMQDGTYAKTDRGGDGWWDDHWIPFLHNMAGATVCVDTTGWSTDDAGQVLEEWHAAATRKITYRDLDAWLETYVMALEAGVLHKMSDSDGIGASEKTGDEGPGFDRWVEYHAAHNPGYPKWLRAEGGH
jgi:cell wall assembly regulator SMI1